MLAASLVAASLAPVGVRSLLNEMTDLSLLARRPSPYYTNAQASSFDRGAYTGDPFANGDAGKFLRTETNQGREEFVMADLRGPGTVVRVWSANPTGKIRFYFDGETDPRLEEDLAGLLTGKRAPFLDPFAYVAGQGTNLYFPFPYSKSLKITAEGPVQGLYYHINHRNYQRGTEVRSFDWKELESAQSQIAEQRKRLLEPYMPRDKKADPLQTIAPGRSLRLDVSRREASAIRYLRIKVPFPLVQTFREMDWDDSYQPHNILRKTILKIQFDGEETVRAPLGDFFATAPGPNPNKTLPFEVTADGTMVCRFVMPFRRSARIEIDNTNPVEVPVAVRVETMPFPWTTDTYLFHAQWQSERGRTRPMRDMRFLTVIGEGIFVGSNLQISNPVPTWWGEGDEKFYVDGERRPSTFGTGTEDYYGYAWGSPQLFSKPYHAQPRCDGPGTLGHSQVQRWHILDAVPFRRSFQFDLELWHWADVEVTMARTNYWYARPGSTPPAPIDHSALLPIEIKGPKPVEGALEGEKLEATATGGELSVQKGFWQPSGGEHRWWVDPKPGDRLTFTVPVPEAGEYEVEGSLCHARDYGIHRLVLYGTSLGERDFYNPDLEWRKLPLGRVWLPKGNVELEVECVGANPKAEARRMFGLDYLLLKPVK